MSTAADSKARYEHGGAASRPVVLIVDDFPGNLIAFEGMLRRDDIEIVTASSGPAALEILLAREVAAAVVDVQMPEMDGFELASLMRGVEKTRHVPIILVTAGSHDKARIFKGYEAGAVDYLFKPVDEHVLRGKVDVFVSLAKQKMALHEAERMREMFIAVLGHDLRNPLSGVLMNAQLIARRRSEGDDIDEPVERILRNGRRMRRMIEQLLDATRFREDGGISLSPAPADLRELAGQVVDELAHTPERFQCEAVGGTTGTWDVDRVMQILSNLIGNADRYGPAGSTVRIEIDGRAQETLTLRVHNGGPPIPDELRGALFEPFRRFDMRRRRDEGLGLGLYITKRLVDVHSGTLTFESSAQAGTSFSVTLPRHVHAQSTEATATSQGVVTDSAATAADRTVLVVEDETSARLALGELLEGEGYRVVTAASPSEALEAAANNDPIDLLISDIRLPEMTGDALAQRLRERYAQMRVIFVSGLPEPPDPQATFVQKPIDVDLLVKIVERTLSSTCEDLPGS